MRDRILLRISDRTDRNQTIYKVVSSEEAGQVLGRQYEMGMTAGFSRVGDPHCFSLDTISQETAALIELMLEEGVRHHRIFDRIISADTNDRCRRSMHSRIKEQVRTLHNLLQDV